jgi:hypothetical protein
MSMSIMSMSMSISRRTGLTRTEQASYTQEASPYQQDKNAQERESKRKQ